MKDLRAEYKKKFKAAEEQEKQFGRLQCDECGIWSLSDHLTKSGNCKYLVLPRLEVDYNYDDHGIKTISLPLSISVTNAGCELFKDEPEQIGEDFSHILDKGITSFENIRELARYYELDIIKDNEDIDLQDVKRFIQDDEQLSCGEIGARIFQWFSARAVFEVLPDTSIYVTSWKDD